MSNLTLYLASVLIWGSTWIAITFQYGVVAAEVSVAYRFWLAAALLMGWCLVRGLKLRFTLREHAWLALQWPGHPGPRSSDFAQSDVTLPATDRPSQSA